ncbi:MAG: 2-C-methyl-D-erythritol 4-phosphate cytidylyltransferase [Bacteroidaceae bacterium]
MKKYVLIVAGGKGLRMGGEVPKQFLPVGGRPVLMRTLDVFHRYDPQMDIVLVLPAAQQDYWRALCREYGFAVPHRVADGGETRFHSVKNGLALVGDEGLVGVHDGVRPFVSAEVIDRLYAEAADGGAAVPVVGVVETLRHLGRTVSRDEYCLVQTPQVFQVPLLKQAYQAPYSPAFTDDASVVEAMGATVRQVEGNRENIKLTTPFDLKIAQALL